MGGPNTTTRTSGKAGALPHATCAAGYPTSITTRTLHEVKPRSLPSVLHAKHLSWNYPPIRRPRESHLRPPPKSALSAAPLPFFADFFTRCRFIKARAKEAAQVGYKVMNRKEGGWRQVKRLLERLLERGEGTGGLAMLVVFTSRPSFSSQETASSELNITTNPLMLQCFIGDHDLLQNHPEY